MNKKVNEVFVNCAGLNNRFLDANVDEIKFSKKLNAVILNSSSSNNVSLSEIEEFEQMACKAYDLNSFKIDFKYTGEKRDIELQDINKIILNMNKYFS